MAPFPILFILSTALVLVGLTWHTLVTYGPVQGRRLLLTLAVLGVLHEVVCPNGYYIVQMRGLRPFGVPLGVSAGWMITALLSLEFARRALWAVAPPLAGRLVPTVFLAAIFGSQLSNAIEPVGQVAGWWIWTTEHAAGEFPHLAPGMWFLTIYFMGTVALVVAGLENRRAWGLAAMVLPIAVGAYVPLPPVLSYALLACAFSVLARVATLRMDGALSWPVGLEIQRWSDVVPLAATMMILGTLAHYAITSPRPEVLAYARGAALLSVAPYVAMGSRRLATAVISDLTARPAIPTASESVLESVNPRAERT